MVEWQEHLASAARRGVSLARYAREQGLSAGGLYAARHALKRRGVVTVGGRAVRERPRFAPVTVLPSAVLRAQLPNGVVVSLEGVDASMLSAWLSSLADLRCGG
jgi:hypothetical protein